MPIIYDNEYGIVYEQYEPLSMSPAYLYETFPEALPAIKKNLKRHKDAYAELEPLYREALDIIIESIYADDAISAERKDLYIKSAANVFYHWPVARLDRHVKRLKRVLDRFTWKENNAAGTITDMDIERAKAFPLTKLIEVNSAGFAHCPFHNEKTPSCKIFKDNKFRCFGCGAHGDAIDYIKHTEDIDFLSAVRKILGT